MNDTRRARKNQISTEKKQYSRDTRFHRIESDQTRNKKRDKQTTTTDKRRNQKITFGAIQYSAKFIPNQSEKTDNMRQIFLKSTKSEGTEERNIDFNS